MNGLIRQYFPKGSDLFYPKQWNSIRQRKAKCLEKLL
jgi:IS30 family transposase